MAEIRVEERRGGLGWLWALVLVLLVALAAWWFLTTANDDGPAVTDPAAGEVTPASPTAAPAMPHHRPAAAMVLRRA